MSPEQIEENVNFVLEDDGNKGYYVYVNGTKLRIPETKEEIIRSRDFGDIDLRTQTIPYNKFKFKNHWKDGALEIQDGIAIIRWELIKETAPVKLTRGKKSEKCDEIKQW